MSATFLGFRLRLDPHSGVVEVLLSERTKRRAMERLRQLTPRNWGRSLGDCIVQINAWVNGWHGFFGIVSVSEMQMMRKIDAHLRRRLRAIVLRHWKRRRTIAKRLVALGVNRRAAWHRVYRGRRSWWALSHAHAVDQGLRNAYFAKRGLIFVVDLHHRLTRRLAARERSGLAFRTATQLLHLALKLAYARLQPLILKRQPRAPLTPTRARESSRTNRVRSHAHSVRQASHNAFPTR